LLSGLEAALVAVLVERRGWVSWVEAWAVDWGEGVAEVSWVRVLVAMLEAADEAGRLGFLEIILLSAKEVCS